MERQQANSLQNFEESKSDILKKRLLKSAVTAVSSNPPQHTPQNNVLNTIRSGASGGMFVQAPHSSIAVGHSLVPHSLAPVKLQTSSAPYPLQLSTVHVPVQIPGTTANVSVPVQLAAPSGPAGDSISVPLQLPSSQAIQLPSMPLLQSQCPGQPLGSIFHVHVGSNQRQSIDGNSDLTGSSQLQLTESAQLKLNNPSSQVQVCSSPTVVQLPSSSSAGLQLTLPSSGPGSLQLRGTGRPMPHMVYIQTPSGLKPVSSSEVISQASSSGNPPQIIVRRPVTSNSNILISNSGIKPNIAPKVAGQKTSILAPGAAQPIVIQKPKPNDKVVYLSSLKKKSENQSILISNNQTSNTGSQKLFLTPMNIPKIQQNAKFILPVTLPATMASKGPIINLQIANGQIQNDPQGNSITVMRETVSSEASEMPPLQPLAKAGTNGRDTNSLPQSPKSDKSFTMSIPGSRAEPTGEQGEYTLSIPETNASLNDDVYTVSIADENGGHRENSFTLAIPEKGKSLLTRNVTDKSELMTAAPPTILRRSNSDNYERKPTTADVKRRVSLCNDNITNKNTAKILLPQPKPAEKLDEQPQAGTNDDHRVPSLFCDEKLEEVKTTVGDSDAEDKERKREADTERSEVEKRDPNYYFQKMEKLLNKERVKRVSVEATAAVEDPLGLVWRSGIAQLKGSDLQFQTNEFGLIDLVDHEPEEMSILNAKYQTPLKQRIERSKKATSPEDMYRCDGCGCHGMAAEFITPNFCSVQCQSDVLKSSQRKRERERMEMMKRRNKVKKLLVRRQPSESDTAGRDYDSTLPPEPPGLDEFVENEKYPWMCGKNGFSWMRYLDHCKAKAAPVKLFKDPFPYNRNGFKVGMRLEAIDPSHPALFCVVSVAEVQGYRLRLHFDEYPDVYDYWVNADCIDLFPAGWCERVGRPLTPPAGYSAAAFSWPLYLKQQRAVAAPKHLFPHLATLQSVKPSGFRIGMKLEAEDRSNDLVCVATVADVLEGRLRITFDSWDDMYDMWVEPSSPYIHPIGWAKEHGVPLTPPNFYKDPESFCWESYLTETGAVAAPARAFKTRPPVGFKPGMKLEVVDPKVPFLIRVGTVCQVSGHRVRVSCDGWGARLAAWRGDDCADLHPVGWCLKTHHPLEPPLTAEESATPGPCGAGGCRGLGSLRGGAHKQHGSARACPYGALAAPPPDRLAPSAAHGHSTARIPAKQLAKLHPSPPTSDSQKDVQPKARGRPPKHKRVEQVAKNEISDDESVSSSKRWRSSLSPMRSYSRATDPRSHEPRDRIREPRNRSHEPRGRSREPRDRSREPRDRSHEPRDRSHKSVERQTRFTPPRLCADRYIAELGLPESPLDWTESEVLSLVCAVAGERAGSALRTAGLRGAELVMATRGELVRAAGLRLGPALKVRALQARLRERLASTAGRPLATAGRGAC